MMEKNTEQAKTKNKLKKLSDQKKEYITDNERKKLLLQKKELRIKEKEMKKMEHLKTFDDFTTITILVGSGGC